MFDFTDAMEDLIRHITACHPKFKHVKPDHLLISYLQTRSPGAHGMYASVMPLRFQGGERTVTKRGKTFAMPEVTHKDREILYLVYFALPRFQNLDFNTKLTTVFHELYHIGPKFNGDIRRFRGKNYAHGHSRKVFNALVSKFADEYMAMPGAEERTAFLRMSFGELCAVHGSVVGTKARPPKPYAVSG